MALDPLRRFSSRAEDYAKYRPSYPGAIPAVLAAECGLSTASAVADIGSGTGLLAKLFLDFGCAVIGIEPNAEMRRLGEQFLSGYPRFQSREGQAENTGLAKGSVNVVAAGQAFHWFEPALARAEFRRILRADGWVVLVWNERLVTNDAFLAGYEELLHRCAPEYARVDHRRINAAALTGFFEHSDWRTFNFENAQHFDLEGVRGRLLSSSYAPQPGAPGHDEMMRDLAALFAATERDGRVVVRYETKMYCGRLPAH